MCVGVEEEGERVCPSNGAERTEGLLRLSNVRRLCFAVYIRARMCTLMNVCVWWCQCI